MKIILAVFIFLFSAGVAKAQTGQSEPTRQDALDFINKLCAKYAKLGYSDHGILGSNRLYATLDGCILTFHFSYDDKSNFYGNRLDRTSQEEIIDLSSVYLKATDYILGASIKANTPGAITFSDRIQTIKISNQKVTDDTGPGNPVVRYEFNVFEFFYRLLITDGYDAEYVDNNYGPRYIKALDFLIKSCGGGTVKTDPNQKF